MFKVAALFGLMAGFLVSVLGAGDENMLGEGVWSLITVQRCENHDDFNVDFDLQRYRINRTSDGFKFRLSLPDDITLSDGIRLEICKHADGGCKPYQVMADDSFCEFINKYAEKNFAGVLEAAGVDGNYCPIPAKEYEVEHVIDYNDLPKEAVYGIFGVTIYLVRDKEDIACIFATVEFKKDDGEDDDD